MRSSPAAYGATRAMLLLLLPLLVLLLPDSGRLPSHRFPLLLWSPWCQRDCGGETGGR